MTTMRAGQALQRTVQPRENEPGPFDRLLNFAVAIFCPIDKPSIWQDDGLHPSFANGKPIMATWLLTWKPNKWRWNNFTSVVNRIKRSGRYRSSWSCGNARTIQVGEPVFFMRQGKDRPGLIGSGVITKAPYEGGQWNEESDRDSAWHVKIEFNVLDDEPIVPKSELVMRPLASSIWDSQSSGVRIRPEIANPLAARWRKRTGALVNFVVPQSLKASLLPEGNKTLVWTTRYERNPLARRQCLERHGYQCSICDLRMRNIYGDVAEAYIHVHHLKPLSVARKRHLVDVAKSLSQ